MDSAERVFAAMKGEEPDQVPIVGMDIGEVKRKYGDRVRLIGNIDCGELLSHGSLESVEDAVAKCVADAGMGGGLMLSSSDSIHSSVDPENYLAMVRAGQKYGKYPLAPETISR